MRDADSTLYCDLCGVAITPANQGQTTAQAILCNQCVKKVRTCHNPVCRTLLVNRRGKLKYYYCGVECGIQHEGRSRDWLKVCKAKGTYTVQPKGYLF